MRKIIIIIVLTIVAFSCSKDLLVENPKGQLVNIGYFTDKTSLDMSITGLYHCVANTVYEEQVLALASGSDDLTSISGSNKQNFLDYDQFFDITYPDKSATAQRDGICWKGFYGLVTQANFIIDGYKNATLATQQQRNFAAGQAYFMRAHANYFIVRMWGSAPLLTSSTMNLATVTNSTPRQFYNLIVSDLQNAEQMLPSTWVGIEPNLSMVTSGTGVGVGVTRGAAKSLLASVYLSMAGYPLKDVSNYALAASKAKEVLDSASVFGYKLLNNYSDLWLDIPTNTEMIYGAFYNPSTNPLNYEAPYSSKPDDETGGWSDYMCEVAFFNSFPAGPRKDATFQTTITTKSRGKITSKPWQQGLRKHPFFQKFRLTNGATWATYDPTASVPINSDRTRPFMRFAEVKLIYAEAQAMSTSPDASAYQQVNDIRNRAGLPNLTPGLGQLAFRDSVVAERGWEFSGGEYCLRWFDLTRLEMVEKANVNRNVGVYVNNKFVSPVAGDPELPLMRLPTKNDYFAPIPLGDRLLNPNLNTQNWGN